MALQKTLSRVLRGLSLGDQLAQRRTDALGRWGQLVETAAANKPVDIDELERLAVVLRLDDPAAAVDADVAALRARAEALAEVAREETIHAETLAAAERAGKKIAAIQAELRTLLVQAEAPVGTAAGLAYARGRVVAAEDQAPRLFGRAILERARVDADGPVTDDQVERFAIGTRARPVGVGAGVAIGEASFEDE